MFHYRDSNGLEADAIIELPDGRWAGFEVKLGSTPAIVDDAAASLLKLKSLVAGEEPWPWASSRGRLFPDPSRRRAPDRGRRTLALGPIPSAGIIGRRPAGVSGAGAGLAPARTNLNPRDRGRPNVAPPTSASCGLRRKVSISTSARRF